MSVEFSQKALPVLLLPLAFLIAGCATFGHDDILRNPGPGSPRFDVDRDIGRYVVQVDRRIRMSSRDERAMARLLRDRTYHLLDRTRPQSRRYVYPFPRRNYRDMNSTQYSFWRDVDRSIERSLPRTQARRYADITRGQDYRQHRRAERGETHRGRGNGGRYEDDRHEDRRYDDDRHHGRRSDDRHDDRRNDDDRNNDRRYDDNRNDDRRYDDNRNGDRRHDSKRYDDGRHENSRDDDDDDDHRKRRRGRD